MSNPDAIVVGSGPNGLAAAIVLAQAGVSVLVLEAEPQIGGAVRSAELTLPGFVHDICSAIHPMAYASPFFRALPLERFGLAWVHPPAALAHPLDNSAPAVLERSVAETANTVGPDREAWIGFMSPVVEAYRDIVEGAVAVPRLLRHPLRLPRLGMRSLRTASTVARRCFRGETARALFAGNAAHSMLPLEKHGTVGIALALMAVGQSDGWPYPRGGAQKLSEALAAYLRSLGGEIQTGYRVQSLEQLPPSRAVLCDISPKQLLQIAGDRLPPRYTRLLKQFRYGLAAFKMDWALDEPVPWRSAECARAGTVHIGGTMEEIEASARAAWKGQASERPFVIVGQHSLFDPSRAPAGKHTLWAYCHVPNGSEIDMRGRMEAQIERFAPGFRDRILARHVMPPRALEAHNANLVGGDILGGLIDVWQTIFRPTLRYWGTPIPGLYLCSASTPPGPGVHGLCGYFAAHLALRQVFKS